jgi:hypothetical protein
LLSPDGLRFARNMAKFCSECGTALEEGDQFCGECGSRAVVSAPPGPAEPTLPQPVAAPGVPPETPPVPSGGSAGWWSNGRHLAAAGAAALVVVGGVIVAILLLAGGSSSGHRVKSAVAASTTTTIDPAVVKAQQDYQGYVVRLENVLQQSTSGRGQVGTLVTGVENGCQVSPYDASQQIRTVIDNRTSVLNQLAGLSAAPNPEAQNFYSLFQQALQSSITADGQYKGWMDYLYTTYYYTLPVGCPGGTPPKNAAYDAARAADGRSTDLKTQFVNAFNPVATRLGQPTWQASDF